jgi:hypothetical protein
MLPDSSVSLYGEFPHCTQNTEFPRFALRQEVQILSSDDKSEFAFLPDHAFWSTQQAAQNIEPFCKATPQLQHTSACIS